MTEKSELENALKNADVGEEKDNQDLNQGGEEKDNQDLNQDSRKKDNKQFYTVKEGKSIVFKGKIFVHGDKINSDFFGNQKKAFKNLIKGGIIIKCH